MSTGPLHGLRVIELAGLAPVPYGGMLLADLGADVLRIERVGGPPEISGPGGPLDRGRRSLAVDLKSASGIAALRRLAREADVLVEGFRPGVAERLGFGPDVLLAENPRLVYARLTGWGQDGPLSSGAGHDVNYVALAGALEPLGRPGERPHPALNLLADFAGGGALVALGILAAVIERERSGRGQVVDAAMVDGASTLMTFVHAMRAAGRWSAEPGTNLLDGAAPFYDTYETADGRYVAVGAVEPRFHEELLRGVGLELLIGRDHLDPAGWDEERELLRRAFLTRTRDEWAAVFDGGDACVTPVLSPWEAPRHPHHVARGSFVEVDGVTQPAPSPRFSRSAPPTPVGMDAGGRDPAATLASWGLAAEDVAALLDGGVG